MNNTANQVMELKSKLQNAIGHKELLNVSGLIGKIHKAEPHQGPDLNSSNTRKTVINLPRYGIMNGQYSACFYDSVVTSGGTECRFALGHTGSKWDILEIKVGGKSVQKYDYFGFLSNQKLKHEKSPDFYAGLGSVIGYYASEQGQKDDVNREMLTFPDGCILNQKLPLGKMPQVSIELTLSSETNNYTVSDNAETNARTVTVSNISFQTLIIENDPDEKAVYSGHYIDYDWVHKSLASGDTTKNFTLAVDSSKTISGVELYIRADADLSNNDNYNKAWSTKLSGTTRVHAKLHGSAASESEIETDEGSEAVYHMMVYNGYPVNNIDEHKHFTFPSATWAGESGEDTAGDFSLQLNFAGINNPLRGVSGHDSPPENLSIKWTGNADEDCRVDFYIRYHRSWSCPSTNVFIVN